MKTATELDQKKKALNNIQKSQDQELIGLERIIKGVEFERDDFKD